jgi:hypothetical protein
MSSTAVTDRIIEALEARGFSNAESIQMIRRVQAGTAIIQQQGKIEADEAYAAGFRAGVLHEKDRMAIEVRRMRWAAQNKALEALGQAGYMSEIQRAADQQAKGYSSQGIDTGGPLWGSLFGREPF